jgi:hypothetical protein
VAHGGLGTLNDYVNDDGERLRVGPRAMPLIDTGEGIGLAAGLVGSLALRVFRAFNLDTDRLVALAAALSSTGQAINRDAR